jgi:tRNA threonylcarbamoyl adenosine modification protein YeaZ
MILLAIETSSPRGSIALLDGAVPLYEASFPEGLLHGREVTARMDEVLRRTGLRPRDLGAVAVSRGPGSFTGLRVGVTAAKTLGFALRIPVVATSSLRVLGAAAQPEGASEGPSGPGPSGPDLRGPDLPGPDLPGTWVLPVIDGRREVLAGALYRADPAGIAAVIEDGIFRPVDLRDAVRRALAPPAPPVGARGVLVFGDAADYFFAELPAAAESDRAESDRAAAPVLVRGPREWDFPRASVLGKLLSEEAARARFDSEAVHALEPAYLRLAYAEAKGFARRRA